MKWRIDYAFYVEADTEPAAREVVENGISASLARDYDFVDSECIGE